MNILIASVGGPTPRSIARRLKKLYPDSKLIGVDANTKALTFYLEGLLDKKISIPRVDNEGYWGKICQICDDEKIDYAFIMPERETTLWRMQKLEGQEWPCPALMPPLKHIQVLADKAVMSDLLKNTSYIPKTIRITPDNPKFEEIANEIGYPCWIRASTGSGGFGSLKLTRKEELDAWLFIHKNVKEFTVSEFLPGRHMANQMLYLNGKLIKNAAVECVEYVMADIAPSKVTGNTSFGRLVNEDYVLDFCEEVMTYLTEKTGEPAHGVYSFDLKEDADGKHKVTEINVRHMAYTGIMAQAGFDLIDDTIKYLTGQEDKIKTGRHYFDKEYIFLRDVDVEPIFMTTSDFIK